MLYPVIGWRAGSPPLSGSNQETRTPPAPLTADTACGLAGGIGSTGSKCENNRGPPDWRKMIAWAASESLDAELFVQLTHPSVAAIKPRPCASTSKPLKSRRFRLPVGQPNVPALQTGPTWIGSFGVASIVA